ncbi:MAG: hypothetical protein ACRD51_12880 [Candidatus Acidiferrum sp.]
MKVADSTSELSRILPTSDLQANPRDPGVLWGFYPPRFESGRRSTPWWLWWNILSLDAPAVAVVWSALFASTSGARLSTAEAIALGLSVWIIYTCDRLLDGWTTKNRAALQERHLFSERHRLLLAASVIVAGALVLWQITGIPLIEDAIAGVKLGAVLILYMAAVHAGRGRLANVLPKEIFVGFLFALGATLPLWSRATQFPWHEFLPWGFFGLLCSLNCLSIECWESARQTRAWRQQSHPLVRWVAPRINSIAAALALAALAACFVQIPPSSSRFALLAVCAGALLILLLNCLRSKLSSAALRVLADAALFAPALIAFLIRR